MSQTELMPGEEQIRNIMATNVLVVGHGGVGAIFAELIAWAGVG